MKSSFIVAMETLRAEARAAFRDAQAAAYLRAEEDTRGAMLNARAMRAGISSLSLFQGPQSRVQAYASPELQEWFYYNRRPQAEEFVAEWVDSALHM